MPNALFGAMAGGAAAGVGGVDGVATEAGLAGTAGVDGVLVGGSYAIEPLATATLQTAPINSSLVLA